ncbi:MFS transporter [Kribbella catacumbae]|uniref:MFS transporter n=1 Tax=Kribbella catacumbae TaxID=460086 RepID=UPI000365EB54|nr:MFS transporter [Kribbella catacumbae]
MSGAEVIAATPRTLARRLLPLEIAVGLQGLILWVAVEKLFMTQIGFDAASIGVMAAAYAAVVPLLEVPSGILADRWSRNWVMVCASLALAASSLLGGLSTSVTTYVLAAMILGVYFAMNSGTVDSVVYDVVMEETGSSDLYETWIGRVRMVESSAFVVSALVGGVLAEWTSARFTYFASVPLIVLAVLAFLRFDEPRLHRSTEPVSLRSHVALTFRTMTRQRDVVRVLLLAALVALVSQLVFEFGPVWLVVLAAPAVLYGPYWAGLVSTLGLGGYLVSRLRLERRTTVVVLALLGPLVAATLALSQSLAVVVVAQIVLALVLAVVGIHAGRLLHDSVPSTIRAGVASGVGTLSWVLFVPVSLAFGWLAREQGVHRSGWILTGTAMIVSLLLVVSAVRRAPVAAEAVAATERAPAPEDLACRELVDLVTDYFDGVLEPGWRAGFEKHQDDCDGCTEYVAQLRITLQALKGLDRAEAARPADDPPH